MVASRRMLQFQIYYLTTLKIESNQHLPQLQKPIITKFVIVYFKPTIYKETNNQRNPLQNTKVNRFNDLRIGRNWKERGGVFLSLQFFCFRKWRTLSLKIIIYRVYRYKHTCNRGRGVGGGGAGASLLLRFCFSE